MDARKEAAERILNRGARFRLPAPFLSRLLKRNVITVRPLKAGTILAFSINVVENGLEEATKKSGFEFLSSSIEPVAKCMAIAILNDEKKIERGADKLAKKLLWKVPRELLVKMFLTVSTMNRVSDFKPITRFFATQMMMMMSPKLGLEKSGS